MFFTVSYPEKSLAENSLYCWAVNIKRNKEISQKIIVYQKQKKRPVQDLGHLEWLWLQSYRVFEQYVTMVNYIPVLEQDSIQRTDLSSNETIGK